MPTLTVTAKGQVTLKKEVLQHLGVRPGDRIDVDLLPGGKLEVIAVKRRPVAGSVESFFEVWRTRRIFMRRSKRSMRP